MKVLDIKYPKQQDDLDKLELLNRTYRTSLEKRIMTDNKLIKLDVPADYAAGLPSYRAPIAIQLEQLMSRSWILAQREPRISRAKIFQTVIVAIFLVPTCWQLNKWTD